MKNFLNVNHVHVYKAQLPAFHLYWQCVHSAAVITGIICDLGLLLNWFVIIIYNVHVNNQELKTGTIAPISCV